MDLFPKRVAHFLIPHRHGTEQPKAETNHQQLKATGHKPKAQNQKTKVQRKKTETTYQKPEVISQKRARQKRLQSICARCVGDGCKGCHYNSLRFNAARDYRRVCELTAQCVLKKSSAWMRCEMCTAGAFFRKPSTVLGPHRRP